MREGDIIGHEPVGIVEEVEHISSGDRGPLARKSNLLGRGWWASLFGRAHLYGGVPGGTFSISGI